MTNMARIHDGVVIEVLKPIDGFDIEDCFHPDILANTVPVGDDVQLGWILTDAGIVDPDAPAPEPVAVEETLVTEEAPTEAPVTEEAPAEEPDAE